jgi:hypothetical protein
MSLIFATQLTAVATAVLAMGAIVTAILAYRAFRKQALEVDILLKQQQREKKERRRAQAARVFVGLTPKRERMQRFPVVENASDFPVFDVQSWYSHPGGLRQSESGNRRVILPGESSSSSAADALTHRILTFRDADGVRWVRMPDGSLTEQAYPNSPRERPRRPQPAAVRASYRDQRGR